MKKLETAYDVAIVGAGPAGATAAIHLARAGCNVALIDKSEFPREKVCGDGLITDSLRCLAKIELLERVRELGNQVNTLSYYSPAKIRVDTQTTILTIKRQILDHLLVKKAKDSGAKFLRGQVVDIKQGDGISVFTDESEISAKVCILATGAQITLGKKLGFIQNSKPNAVAVRCYVKAPVHLEKVVISYDRIFAPAGYGWIFPMGNQEFNIGCGVFKSGDVPDLRKLFSVFINSFPLAKVLMENAKGQTRLIGFPLRCGFVGTRNYRSGRILSIGESVGTTFPFTGEGIGKAMESGEIAASAVTGFLSSGNVSDLATYEENLRSDLLPKYKGYLKAERLLSNGFFNDLLALRAKRSRYLQEKVKDLIEERADLQEIFSWKGVLRAIVG